MVSVRRLSRRGPLAAACATVALLALPAASQAELVSSSACTVPAATQQFPGDLHSYYDAGALSVSPGSPQSVQACVNVAHPTVRLNVASADPGARLSLVAVFNTDQGTVAVPFGHIDATPGLSRVLTVDPVGRASLRATGTVAFTVVVRASGGSVSVADTWIDPWGG